MSGPSQDGWTDGGMVGWTDGLMDGSEDMRLKGMDDEKSMGAHEDSKKWMDAWTGVDSIGFDCICLDWIGWKL